MDPIETVKAKFADQVLSVGFSRMTGPSGTSPKPSTSK